VRGERASESMVGLVCVSEANLVEVVVDGGRWVVSRRKGRKKERQRWSVWRVGAMCM
jgi:hypothetical protein